MAKSPSSTIRQVDQWVKPHGWTRSQRKGNHIIYSSPDGKNRVVVSASASDQRALLNIRADLRRHGCPI